MDQLFYLIYQPIVRIIKDGEFESNEYEVLLRSKITHKFPENEFNEIIQSDEVNGQFLDWYGKKIMKKAAENKSVCFSINFHSEQWRHPSTFVFLKKMTPLCNRLVIELTEYIPTSYDIRNYSQVLKAIQHYGFLIVVDDVGTGINSLSFLVQHVDYIYRIKFSLLHFKNMKSPVLESFIHSWLKFASEYEKELVIEGVDCLSKSMDLFKKGIVLQQGYFFGKGDMLEEEISL